MNFNYIIFDRDKFDLHKVNKKVKVFRCIWDIDNYCLEMNIKNYLIIKL